MFGGRSATNIGGSAVTTTTLIYHNAARNVRKTHPNAVMAIVMNMVQVLMLVAVFYVMFMLLGLRGSAIRGDFFLYLLSGIFMFITHVKSVKAVFSSEGPASPMMNHLPMTTAIAISSSALSTLYLQILSILVILFIYDAISGPIEIYQPVYALGMLFLAWFSGCAVGMVFLALKPWAPRFSQTAMMIYQRANMIASGKMFVANSLPGFMIVYFDWNPLFHIIDQTRGYTFINYFPHFTSLTYPIIVSLIVLAIGLMGEFYTRKNASMSWEARR